MGEYLSAIKAIYRDSERQTILRQEDHVCPPEKISQVVSTPAAGWLSMGFSAIAAGASVFAVFQLARQQKVLEQIVRQLNLTNKKLDYVIHSIDQIKVNTSKTNQLLYVKDVLDGSRINFEDKLKHGEITLESLNGLIGDIEMTLQEVYSNKTEGDVSIPNYIIEGANSVFSFIKILNIFLVECHNRFIEYDPMLVQRYESIDGFPSFLREKMLKERLKEVKVPAELWNTLKEKLGNSVIKELNEVFGFFDDDDYDENIRRKARKNINAIVNGFIKGVSDEMSRKAPNEKLQKEPVKQEESDDNQDSKLLLDDLFNIWSRYKSTSDQQPRLKWLNAFLWETKLLLFTYYRTPVLSLDNAPIMIPSIAPQTLQEMMRNKAEDVPFSSQ